MSLTSKKKTVHLPEIVGKGYKDFWNFKGQYRVVKGSRSSKKSKTTALNYIVRMMQYPQANLLVVRKTFATLKDSCYTELKWAINRLGVTAFWDCKLSPLEIVYRQTGQKILFRGMDDPLKITSITVEVGFLCWLWVEEAYELADMTDFDMLDESIRGDLPKGLFKQATLTFNPWNGSHWLKMRFFDETQTPDILAKTTNYTCNEFLGEADLRLFDEMKRKNPKRYQVAGLGEWGVTDGVVFDNIRAEPITDEHILAFDNVRRGIDFGYATDPAAYVVSHYDKKRRTLYIYHEVYAVGMKNRELAERIKAENPHRGIITADSAEPKSIDELRYDHNLNVYKAKKGPDSIEYGVKFLQDMDAIIIDPARCPNTLREFNSYALEPDGYGGFKRRFVDKNNHTIDSVRYSLENDMLQAGRISFL